MAANVSGRICLVTGASDGIGKASAAALAREGAHVVMVARSREKTEAAAAEVRAQAPGAVVETMIADLSVLAEVRRLAAAFRERHTKLHVLLNNVGGIFAKREVTADGFERTFALDHLSYFLLTHELLGLLEASAPARIVNVSSGAEAGGHIRFDDLQMERAYTAFGAYSQAKLANILFTYELARRIAGTGVTANVMHPGPVASRFALNNKGVLGLAVRLAHPFLLSPQKGADTAVWLASAPEVADVSGRYFIKRRERTSSKRSYDIEAQQKLWAVSEELCGLQRSGAGAEIR